MEKAGFETDYMPDRPSEGVLFKSLGRISYRLVEDRIQKHADALLEKLQQNNYDLVFFVGGMSICLTRENFQALKDVSDAKFVLYLWDALKNCQRVGSYLDLFDRVLSFEKADCKDYSLTFLPLFYVRDYADIPLKPNDGFEYDACFVGSVHQVAKFRRIQQMITALEEQGAHVYAHYYMPSRSVAVLRYLQYPEYRKAKLRFDSLGRKQVADLYSRTRTVIDSPQQGQQGLTMRTIETLGAKRRLVTANDAVKQYDFFKSGNVQVCSEGEFPSVEFVTSDPIEIDQTIYESYSITSWFANVLDAIGIEAS